MAGNVSRMLRRAERAETEPGYKANMAKRAEELSEKRKKRVNKRCVDCGELIEPKSTRCKRCNQIFLRNRK